MPMVVCLVVKETLQQFFYFYFTFFERGGGINNSNVWSETNDKKNNWDEGSLSRIRIKY